MTASYSFKLATANDDADLRKLLRETPLRGTIEVTLEREPSFFHAVRCQGSAEQTLVVRATCSGAVVGLGTRVLSTVYWQGRPQTVAYLGDLRIAKAHRGGLLLARGYRRLREWHADGRAAATLTAVFDDNRTAIEVLTSGRAGLPTYTDVGGIDCPGILTGRRPLAINPALTIVSASHAVLPEIVDFLNAYNRDRDFAPVHQVGDFGPSGRWRGLALEDIFLAYRGNTLRGVLAGWDQRGFKQTRVQRYHGMLRGLRPVLNVGRRLRGRAILPAPGAVLPFGHAAFFAVAEDDTATGVGLLRALHNQALARGHLFFMIAMHEADPRRRWLDNFRRIPMRGRLYAVSFENEKPLASTGRSIHVESGLL